MEEKQKEKQKPYVTSARVDVVFSFCCCRNEGCCTQNQVTGVDAARGSIGRVVVVCFYLPLRPGSCILYGRVLANLCPCLGLTEIAILHFSSNSSNSTKSILYRVLTYCNFFSFSSKINVSTLLFSGLLSNRLHLIALTAGEPLAGRSGHSRGAFASIGCTITRFDIFFLHYFFLVSCFNLGFSFDFLCFSLSACVRVCVLCAFTSLHTFLFWCSFALNKHSHARTDTQTHTVTVVSRKCLKLSSGGKVT